MARLVPFTPSILRTCLALALLTVGAAGCHVEYSNQSPSAERSELRATVYGTANPRSESDRTDGNGPSAAPNNGGEQAVSVESDEPAGGSIVPAMRPIAIEHPKENDAHGTVEGDRDRSLPEEVAKLQREERRVAAWIRDADLRTRIAVLRARQEQIRELIAQLDDAERRYLQSLDGAGQPESIPLNRRLDLFRDLRRRLKEQDDSLDERLRLESPRDAGSP